MHGAMILWQGQVAGVMFCAWQQGQAGDMQPALAASEGAAVAQTLLPDLAVLDERLMQPAMAHHSSSHRSNVRACCYCICRKFLPDYIICVPSLASLLMRHLNFMGRIIGRRRCILFTHQRNSDKHNLAISIPFLSTTLSVPM